MRIFWLCVGAVAGMLLVPIGAVLAFADLDRADKVASVAGALIGAAGLVASIIAVLASRRVSSSVAAQSVSASTVGANLVQVHDARQKVSIALAAPPNPANPPVAPRRAPASADAVPGGVQGVSDVRATGSVVQVSGAAGDVEVG